MDLRSSAQLKRVLLSRKPGGAALSLKVSSSSVVETSKQENTEDMERARVRDENQGDGDRDGDTTASAVSLKRAVKGLHFGDEAEKALAAMEIRKLAREDPKAKRLLGKLGVVHVLVDMMVSDGDGDCRRRSAALGALLELSRGETRKNKVEMLEAGILMRLPMDIRVFGQETRHEMAELLLELSSTMGHEESWSVIEVVISTLESDLEHETKVSLLGALHHFSNSLETAARLASDRMVDLLQRLSSSKDFSEKALAILGNVIATKQGKQALENSPMAPENLIEILTWEEKPKCQELSAHVLMILANQSTEQRQKMVKSGIVQVLLELALLGRSTLAQKRALKLLQWFKDERGVRVSLHSGHQTSGRGLLGSPAADYLEAREGRMMMQKLVKESLHRNMEVITKRVNNGDLALSLAPRQWSLASTSSKSLRYSCNVHDED